MLEVSSRLVPSRSSSDSDEPDGAVSEPSSSSCLVVPTALPVAPSPRYLERLERARTGRMLLRTQVAQLDLDAWSSLRVGSPRTNQHVRSPRANPHVGSPQTNQQVGSPREVTNRGVEVVEALIVGFLTKKASSFPFNWRERYVTVDAATRTLSYYKSELEARGRSKPKGQTAAVLSASELPNEPRGIRFEDAAGRVLFALARSEADRERWLQSLRTAFEPHTSGAEAMVATGEWMAALPAPTIVAAAAIRPE